MKDRSLWQILSVLCRKKLVQEKSGRLRSNPEKGPVASGLRGPRLCGRGGL